PAEIVTAHGAHADVRVGEAVVRGVPVHGTARPGAATLLLRPERINLARGGEGLPATVTDITFLGNNFHVAAVTPKGEPLSVRLPFGHAAAASLSRGETVSLSFDPATAHVFC
ncbi:MAG: TOBE domain-containing protein, partial [Amaricoccus sp.]